MTNLNKLEQKLKAKKEKRDLKQKYSDKLSTSKLLIAFLFLNCTIIEIFTGWVTLRSFDLAEITGMSPDLTPLITIIGAVVGEVIGFAIYSVKSLKENTKGGIVYESAMAKIYSQEEEAEG